MGVQMPAYRAYRLDDRRRILNGQWLEAPDDAAAMRYCAAAPAA